MDALQWDDLKGKLNLKTASVGTSRWSYYLDCLVFDEYLSASRRGVWKLAGR